MFETRRHGAIRLALALVAAALFGGDALAQQSGTLLSQGITARKGATDPIIGIEVNGGALGKGALTQTKLIIDIGVDGNATPPPADPALPAGFRFRLSKTGAPSPIEFTTTGGTSTSFTDKTVALIHGLENTAAPLGLYSLAIVHVTGVPAMAAETYSLELVGLPAGLRVVVTIDQGVFTSLNTTGPCGASCPSGQTCQTSPCPTLCPIGQSCRGACPRLPCMGPWRYYEVEIVWPRKFPPGPWPCLQCPEAWKQQFDPREFERVIVTWLPTDEQRRAFEGGKSDVRFDINGGQPIGAILEGGQGEFTQLVQYPRGKPPLVTVMAGGQSVGEFRADRSEATPPQDGFRNWLYGLLGLVIGAIGSFFGTRRRPDGPRTSGQP